MAKISIVIPTLPENYERLNKCINSLLKFKSDNNEIEFCIVPNDWKGFEKPVNQGLKIATGNYILICNDDVTATEPYWDENMIRGFRNGKNVGMVNGTGYEWKNLPSYWFVMMTWECYEKVGGLDENFFVFGSDHDHAMRILKADFEINHLFGGCLGIQHQQCSTTRSEKFRERIGDEQELIKQNKKLFESKWGFR